MFIRPYEGATFVPPADRVEQDARALSSGTIATLTNLSRYDEIDAAQWEFVQWIQQQLKSGRGFRSWIHAWIIYKETA